jgi:hypothetical protein
MENKIVNIQPLEGVGTEYGQFLSFLNLKVDESKLFLTFQLFYYPKVKVRDRLNRSLVGFQSRSVGLVEEKFCCFYRESNLGLHGYTVICTTKTSRKTDSNGPFYVRLIMQKLCSFRKHKLAARNVNNSFVRKEI